MIRAVIKNGVIQPLEPLPADWIEGQEVEIWGQVVGPDDPESIDKWYQELEAIAAETPEDPEDDARIDAALAEADRGDKEAVRRQWGLSE